jgi:hypothetical protein
MTETHIFSPEEATEFGRTQMDGGTALQILNHLQELDQLPEEERAPWGSEKRSLESASKLAIQAFSLKQLTANRLNAQLSTGPRTLEGLCRSSLNALKHGLTGKLRLVGSEEKAQFDEHAARMRAIYQPVNAAEFELVSELSDTRWRLGRIPRLEAALFAKGRMLFRDQFADVDLDLQADLVEAEVLLHYANDLRNLHLQEARLRRTQRDLESKLEVVQSQRKLAEREQQREAAAAQGSSAGRNSSSSPSTAGNKSPNGFVFSNDKQSVSLNTHPSANTPNQPDRGAKISGEKRK